MKRVRKAIIPAAGLGTRFLPATKALAKEMLPIVDKPTIQFIVEEARKSGIEDIVVVDGKNKRSIEDHFDSNPELEDNLRSKHKDDHNGLNRPDKIHSTDFDKVIEGGFAPDTSRPPHPFSVGNLQAVVGSCGVGVT